MAKAVAASFLERAKNPKWANTNEYLAMHAKAYSEWLHMVSGANVTRALANSKETEKANNSEKDKEEDRANEEKDKEEE